MKPVFFLHGDDPLAQMEAGDAIRKAAREQGYSEREVIHAVGAADWNNFTQSANSMSLFAERRVIELRIPSGKPGNEGSAAIKSMMNSLPPDVLFLITTVRLESSATRSAWFKAIDSAGFTLAFWQKSVAELPRWIEQRMQKAGLTPTPEAVKAIAVRVEGNMLAAQQEIDLLSLLHPDQEIDEQQVLAAVADSSRYKIGDAVDAALQGAALRALKVLRGQQAEGVNAIPVLWWFTSEIRSGTRIAQSLAVGVSPDAAFKAAGVWQNRRAGLQLALSRHNEQSWLEMLAKTASIDRLAKGQDSGSGAGNVWDELADLCLQLATNKVALPGA